MIRQLLFIAALLAPGLAYGGTATNTLNAPQVVDPPGSAPQAPAPAAAAGFTTCVVCMDFTVPTGGVWVNGTAVSGVNTAQVNTWLAADGGSCGGASSPIAWHYAKFMGPKGTGASGVPCLDITSDGAGNSQVLHVVLPPLPTINDNNANGFELYDNTTAQGVKVPTNNYMEATYWVQSFPPTAYSTGPFLGGGGEIPSGEWNSLEFDAFEINTPGPGGQSSNSGSWWSGNTSLGSNWFGSYPPNYSGYNPASGYHVIGERITSDGSTTLYKCMWLDGIFQNCIHASVNGSTFVASQLSDATSRMETYFHPVGGPIWNGAQPTTMVSYTKSFRIWSCANWQTTACSTPGNPDPGGY
jgi:hypothetical protein